MSNEVAIQIENLSKRYRYGGVAPLSSNLRADITDWVRGIFSSRNGQKLNHRDAEKSEVVSSNMPGATNSVDSVVKAPSHPSFHEVHERHLNESPDYFWALRDVNLEVKKGEVVGIIGQNGAGKSTLLKILSRITPPTTGKITYNGRISSLLEVGTGFHRELTGRENIFLNGSILGMKRVEIAKKFDEIVAFSEVEKFIDTPVKFYSSGMFVRLAFAVAAHLDPEILIIDEVLAVGDASFQKKCIGKIGEISKGGRTVLFVSHNLTVVSTLCTRAMLLETGRMVAEGSTQAVVSAYIAAHATSTGEMLWDRNDGHANNGRLRLVKARVVANSQITADVQIDEPFAVEFDFEVLKEGLNISSSIHVFDKVGTWVFCSGVGTRGSLARGRYRHSYLFPAPLMNDGLYTITIILLTDATRFEINIPNAISFTVHESKGRAGEFLGVVHGCVRPRLTVTHTAIPPEESKA
jgi:lipopolysaccharide transport system ATP-binding protein